MKKILIIVLSLVCVCGLVAYANRALNIAQLQREYPQFFDLSTDDKLNVFVWQMSEDSYDCWLDNRDEAAAEKSYFAEAGATIAEMKVILSTYDVERKDIVICPVIHPLSSYYMEIDDTYRKKVEDLFWND